MFNPFQNQNPFPVQPQPQQPDLMQQFKIFAQNYKGMDPQMVVQQLINSGQMTQEQFNQLRAIANQLTGRHF